LGIDLDMVVEADHDPVLVCEWALKLGPFL
jgi:hypothetical protein